MIHVPLAWRASLVYTSVGSHLSRGNGPFPCPCQCSAHPSSLCTVLPGKPVLKRRVGQSASLARFSPGGGGPDDPSHQEKGIMSTTQLNRPPVVMGLMFFPQCR